MHPDHSSIVHVSVTSIAARTLQLTSTRATISHACRGLALLACLSTAVVASAAFAGSVFKWTDENGVIHYSDQKPASGASKMKVTTTGSAAQNSGAKTRNVNSGQETSNEEDGFDLNPELQSQIKKLEKQQQVDEVQAKIDAATAAELNRKQQHCASLRENMKTIQENARVRVNADDGGNRYLSAKEVVERRSEIEAGLARDCS